MRKLGIDYGDSRVGLAITDELNITVQGLETVHHNGNDKLVLKRLDEILNYSAIAYATLADYVTPITEKDVETFENYADMYCQKGNEHPEARTTRDNDIRTILGNKIFSDPRVSTNTLISMKLGMKYSRIN